MLQGDAGLLPSWQPEFRMALRASSRILASLPQSVPRFPTSPPSSWIDIVSGEVEEATFSEARA